MAEGEVLHILVDDRRGLDDEMRDRLARSLIAELNEHQPGAASLGAAEAPPGSKAGEWAMTAEVAISLGALASSWAVPVLERWLDRQDAETTLTLKGKNAEGKYFEVSVAGEAPADVLEKLNNFLPRAK